MKRLQGKVAAITGGNSGIGKGIAQQFVEEGAKVVIFGRNASALDQTKAELMDNIITVQGDVTNSADLKRLFETTVSQFGNIDILVANAGVGERIHINDVKEDDFSHMVDINYRGLFFTVKYALDHLNKHASIMLIASATAHNTLKSHSIYSSTKAAVIKLAENLSFDLSDQLIRVNSISPGYIKTPIFDTRLAKDPDYLKTREVNIPLKRIGTPKDIANVACFLASDESSYITGTDILVDGGLSSSTILGG